jgi:hypothetical protein
LLKTRLEQVERERKDHVLRGEVTSKQKDRWRFDLLTALEEMAPEELEALLDDHDTLTARLGQAERERDVLRRIVENRYPQWAMSGGVNECKHGFAEGIPCRECDADELARLKEQG